LIGHFQAGISCFGRPAIHFTAGGQKAGLLGKAMNLAVGTDHALLAQSADSNHVAEQVAEALRERQSSSCPTTNADLYRAENSHIERRTTTSPAEPDTTAQCFSRTAIDG
jgi:hypothetical protein